MNNIEFVDGFWWPIKAGKSCRDYTLERKDAPQKISQYVKNKGTVIHAGANVGYYANQFADIFRRQYVFEPDYLNFVCLNLNLIQQNTYKFQSFLGNRRGLFNLEINESDSGGHNIGKSPQKGNIPIIRIDDLELDECDLIALDVEGYEEEVLKGAINTITKFRPVISVEIGWANCSGFLEILGYNKVDDVYGDWVFVSK